MYGRLMPKHIMVCVSGFSGAGKDEFAARLVKGFGAVQTGLADPAKRHMADAYGFTEQQLFGPSKFRNAGDVRFPKNTFREAALSRWEGPLPTAETGLVGKLDGEKRWWWYEGRGSDDHPYVPTRLGKSAILVKEEDPKFWLSPRESLQLYCELMNNLDINTWIRKGVEDQVFIASGKYGYSRMGGVLRSEQDWTEGMDRVVTCFADFRHIHEVRYVKQFRSLIPFVPVTVRVKRPSVPTPPYAHRSETEQVMIRDAAFDFVVDNDATVEALHLRADEIVEAASSPSWAPKAWSNDYVLADRRPEEGYAP
jgi:hypothetical protein